MIKENCLSCKYFTYWDGDYCCLHISGDWNILSEGEELPRPINIKCDKYENNN